MSRINIQGIIDNIRSKSNVYTPVVEAIVNSIQSIINKDIPNGKIEITLFRHQTLEFENSIPEIKSITIRDNGKGFNQANRDSFDTFYSELKKTIGGKGFGRFMFVKYFDRVSVESVFNKDETQLNSRQFRFGRKFEIIVDEIIEDTNAQDTYSILKLENLKDSHAFDKQIETISKRLLEKLLIFFVNDSFNCPTIIIKEADGSGQIILNDYLTGKNEIQLFNEFKFQLLDKSTSELTEFKGKIFKIYYPGHQKSKISLTGHNREVTETNLHKYIPEFEDDFYDEDKQTGVRKNYIIKTYILSDYLDNNVSLEREAFDFGKEKGDAYYPFSQVDIEKEAAEKTREFFDKDVSTRAEVKKTKVRNYVNNQAPWHKPFLRELDLSQIGYNVKDNDIEIALQTIKFNKEQNTRAKIQELIDSTDENGDEMNEAISQISEIGKSDLAHYVFNRKCVLDAMKNLLKRREDGKGNLEKDIHNLIYPMRKNSEQIGYEDHNLWLLDERLVFSEFVASDQKISAKKGALGEPDLVVFDQKRSFRNGDNEFSNPLTIFEFKRPKRKNYREADDPILQIGKYLKEIRIGKFEMPEGLEAIKVNECTPVFGYVIADITDKIEEFAIKHQLTQSPDKEGYFGFHRGYQMYLEIISFKKLLTDATLRNKIFFKKLQLE